MNYNNNLEKNNNHINDVNSDNKIIKITFGILFVLLIVLFAIYIFQTTKENEKIPEFDFKIGAVGYEFEKPFVSNEFEYDLIIDSNEVQIVCSTKINVEGCNEVLRLDNNVIDHVVKYNYSSNKTYEYIIHIKRKETVNNIKINSISNNNGNIVIDAYSLDSSILEYSFDSGVTWQNSGTYKVYGNGIVEAIIRDGNGNTTDKITIEINDIDTVAPTVDIIVQEKSNTKIILYAEAKDNYSGIEAYNWNDSGYVNSKIYEVTNPGTYTVIVKDKAGNESVKKSITITVNDFANNSNNNNNSSEKENKKTYTINFINNGAKISTTKLTCSTNEINCKIKLPTISRDNGVVVGWSENKDLNVASYKSGEEITITENKTLYAITYKTATVTFNQNRATSIGNSYLSCTMYNTNNSCNIVLPTIIKNNGTVVGWSKDKDAATAEYKVGQSISVSSNMTLYAITKENTATPQKKTITITFGQNGATSIGSKSLSCETTGTSCNITLPTITKNDGTVIGWSKGKDATTAEYKVGQNLSVSSNMTLYAITKENVVLQKKKFTITFNQNGATNIGSKSLSCQTTGTNCSITLPTITRNGGTIIGWSKSSSSTTAEYKVGQNLSVNENMTLYAITRKELVATFDPMNLTTTLSSKRLSCVSYNTLGCNITLPTYTRLGRFDRYWSENSRASDDLSNSSYSPNDFLEIGSTVTLHDNTTFYPNFNNPSHYYFPNQINYKYRSFNMQDSYNIGQTRYEYESGIPSYKISSSKSFINRVYNTMPYLFVPCKVFVLTASSYSNYSKAYGLTSYGINDYPIIDIQYDSYGNIDENATLHELAHAWDYYYSVKTGGGRIYEQSEFKEFYSRIYPKLLNSSSGKLSSVETFAAMVTNYYWHTLGNRPSAEWYGLNSGYTLTTQEQNEFKAILDKYKNL